MSNIEGIKWVADGEPNFYTLLSGKNWFGKLQLNGEMHPVAQEKFLNGLFPHLKEEASKSVTPLTPVKIIEIMIDWLECNVDMGTPIIFDNDDDKTDSAKALPAMYEALRVLRGIGGQS
ncbi:hypothetical protein UXP18_18535 [Enterobacter asburiae]|uniref:hypothetical protein n=1 Tax=Enterobacter asburiae TaxID=61645 RepID=UPI002FD4927E